MTCFEISQKVARVHHSNRVSDQRWTPRVTIVSSTDKNDTTS